MIGIVTSELKNNLNTFFNEIDLVFEYIDKSKVSSLREFLTKLDDEETLKQFAKSVCEYLQPYQSNMYVVMSKPKAKTADFNFLDEIKMFDDILEFNNFKDENKNTKLTIAKYLYNIYMSCLVLQFGNESDNQAINSFVETLLKQQQQTDQTSKTTDKKKKRGGSSANVGTGNFEHVFESLMSNKEIMSIASDLTRDIQRENLDPMEMLTSMMSGKPNAKLTGFINNITGKIEQKINSGEIDKKMLETQAQSLMNTVKSTSDLHNFIPPQIKEQLQEQLEDLD